MELIMLSAILLTAISWFYYRKYRAERKKHFLTRKKLRRQVQNKDYQLYMLRQKLHEDAKPKIHVNLSVNKTYIISKKTNVLNGRKG